MATCRQGLDRLRSSFVVAPRGVDCASEAAVEAIPASCKERSFASRLLHVARTCFLTSSASSGVRFCEGQHATLAFAFKLTHLEPFEPFENTLRSSNGGCVGDELTHLASNNRSSGFGHAANEICF